MTKFFHIAALTSIAALTGSAVAADVLPTPHQKPGLWQGETTMAGHKMESQSCVDAASEAQTSAFSAEARKNGKCKSQQITHNPDGSWTVVSTCAFRPGDERTTRADISGDFNSKIVMTMRSPPDAATPEMTMTSTWLGACKPGQRPGDVIMSNGMKMNVLDAMKPHPQ